MACGSCRTTGSFEGAPQQDMHLAHNHEYTSNLDRIGITDQGEDASIEASTKHWKHKMCHLGFGPKYSNWSEDLQCSK